MGRRIDTQSQVVYHIQDNCPSTERSPLCEIIEPIDEESESTASLVDRWVAFDQTNSIGSMQSSFTIRIESCLVSRGSRLFVWYYGVL